MAELCIEYFQRFRRQTYVTPKSYLSFIAGYKTIYSEKKGEIGILAERMNTGGSMILIVKNWEFSFTYKKFQDIQLSNVVILDPFDWISI